MSRSYDDKREIPLLTCWDDVFNRPRFAADINGKTAQLLRVIAPYGPFQPFRPCGLSNCHTPHGTGFLIEAADGRETNIGFDCGKKHFPDSFHMMALAVRRIVDERIVRARAAEAKEALRAVEDEIADMKADPMGADWVERCSRRLRLALIGIDDYLWGNLRRKAASGNPDVHVLRKLKKHEIRTEVRVTGRGQTRTDRGPTHVEEKVGQFVGLEVFLPERDLRSLLVTRLGNLVADLKSCDVDADPIKRVRSLVREYGEIPATLQQVRWAVEAGRKFFTDENLALLPFLTQVPDHKLALQRVSLQQLAAR